jgi:hypothetical protein
MGKIRIFTQEEEAIIHNYHKAKRLKLTTGLNEGYGCWEDLLIVDNEGVRVDRNIMGDEGDFLDVEDMTEGYLDMEFQEEIGNGK